RSRGPGDGDSELENIIPSIRVLAETDALPSVCVHRIPPGLRTQPRLDTLRSPSETPSTIRRRLIS
ncbi:MAG: hypothetical protein WCI75_17605, partial [candidate division NC10 bacterium]